MMWSVSQIKHSKFNRYTSLEQFQLIFWPLFQRSRSCFSMCLAAQSFWSLAAQSSTGSPLCRFYRFEGELHYTLYRFARFATGSLAVRPVRYQFATGFDRYATTGSNLMCLFVELYWLFQQCPGPVSSPVRNWTSEPPTGTNLPV